MGVVEELGKDDRNVKLGDRVVNISTIARGPLRLPGPVSVEPEPSP